jgi:SAM-dependent methyltransferase
MQPAEYERMAAIEGEHWWWRARREIIAETIERYVPPAGNGERQVVEVGCGTGGNLPMLARFGRVLAAEHEPLALSHVRRQHGDRFEILPHKIPEPLPRRFDLLAMLDVLEHVEDDSGALVWVSEQLAPGGLAVITVPAFRFLWSELDGAVHHFRRYRPSTLRALVPPSLEVLHLTCYNSVLFPPIAGVRLAQRLLPKKKRSAGEQLGLPPRAVNWLFYRLFRMERHVAPRLSVPFGVSVLAVLRRPAAP